MAINFQKLVEGVLDKPYFGDRGEFINWLKQHQAPVNAIRRGKSGAYRAFLYGRLPELRGPLKNQVNIIEWSPGSSVVKLIGGDLSTTGVLGKLPFDSQDDAFMASMFPYRAKR